jgi:hypothetical protein
MFWCSACNSLLGTLCPGLPQVCICTPEEHGWGEKTVEVTGLNQAMALTTEERGCADQLARFFPNLPGVRIPVRVAPLRAGSSPARVQESVLVEYGSEEYAIFLSTLPLEFADRVSISGNGGGRSAEATVIALQYHEGRKAVAVRFVEGPCGWMRQS